MRLILAILLLLGFVGQAEAHHHRHHRIHHYRSHRVARHESRRDYSGGGIITAQTLAGPIHVAAEAASRFVALTNALWREGFRGRVNCFAATGHIPHSLHHSGRACDFAQTGWNRTVGIMYHSTRLIESFGLRDGCTFHSRRDCGHVDTGQSIRVASYRSYREARRFSTQIEGRLGRSDADVRYPQTFINGGYAVRERRPRYSRHHWSWNYSENYGDHITTASWYGHGRRTASGERFNPDALTAASPNLPFGTRIQVDYRGRSAIVRINDRGPSRRTGRGLDLSRGAARALGFRGVGQVTWHRM